MTIDEVIDLISLLFGCPNKVKYKYNLHYTVYIAVHSTPKLYTHKHETSIINTYQSNSFSQQVRNSQIFYVHHDHTTNHTAPYQIVSYVHS